MLPDKTLLVKEAGNDRPAVFLSDLLVLVLHLAIQPIAIVVEGLRVIEIYWFAFSIYTMLNKDDQTDLGSF